MKNTTVTFNPSLAGILGIAFIILKLLGVIAWSWWWVLAPFWIPFAIALVVFVVAFFLFYGKNAY